MGIDAGTTPSIGSPAQNLIGYQLLATATLASPAQLLRCQNIPARTNYMIIISCMGKAANDILLMEFDDDNSTTYDFRTSSNGGADATTASASSTQVETVSQGGPTYAVFFVTNVSTNRKRFVGWSVSGGSVGVAPNRCEVVGLYENNSVQITEVDLVTATNNMSTGTQVQVYGSN